MRHEMRPMAVCRLRPVLEAALGGPVDAQAMASIATLSGRLPGLARAIALSGAQAAAPAGAEDPWRPVVPSWPSALGQTLEALLVDASDEDIDALTLLAVGGQLGVGDAQALVPAERIERLGELGLIDFVDGPQGGTVGLYPPVMCEYLRAECSATKRVAIRQLFARKGVALPDDLVAEQSPVAPVDSAILSRTMAAHWSVTARERLARWQEDPAPSTAIDLLTAALVADESVVDPGAVYEATVAAAAATGDEGSASLAELATWYAVYLALGRADRQGADRVLADAGSRHPQGRESLAAISRYLELLAERVPTANEAERGGATAELHAVDVAIDVTRGDMAAAVARLTQRPVRGEMFRHPDGVFRALALMLNGDTAQGLALAQHGFIVAQRDWDPVALQAYGFAFALATAIRGQFSELDDVFSHVMTMTSLSPLQTQYRTGVAGLAVARSGWFGAGRPSGVGTEPGDDAVERFGPLPFSAGPRWHAAEQAARRGYVTAAAFAAVEAAERDPDAARFARVEPVLSTAASPFVRALSDLAEAMTRRDPAGLAKLGDTFADHEAWLYAARAGIQSALVLREAGEYAAAARRARECWERVTPPAPGTAGLFARLVASVELSPREKQIAELVGQGRATNEIAHALVLSARTVEHHLLNIYRKVGVDSRDGLRAAFATWLCPVYPHAAAA
jgi:DNA-binding CsgD family transcriptional regulator